MRTFTKDNTNVAKGVAIILLLFHHCFWEPARYAGHEVIFFPFSEHMVNSCSNAARVCVGLFTFLSAYGMTRGYQGLRLRGELDVQHTARAIARRYVNLMSGYLFVFLFLQAYSFAMGFGRFEAMYGTGASAFLFFAIDLLGLGGAFGTPMFVATFWYMALAQVVVLLVPLFYAIARRAGFAPLLALTVLARAVLPRNDAIALSKNLPTYLFVVALGMAFAEYDVFERIRQKRLPVSSDALARLSKLLVELVLLCVAVAARQATRATGQLPLWDAVTCALTCAILYEFVSPASPPGRVLGLLGRHSMNIFLVHNFVRIVWYNDFTYGFAHFALIVCVLLAVSLGVSAALEQAKRILRYDRAVELVREGLDARIVRLCVRP